MKIKLHFAPVVWLLSVVISGFAEARTAETCNRGHELSYWFASPAVSWESETLPVGNGNIGANVFGGISEEHLTFNEKSLWRGGPNTSGGVGYYWNVNKKPAFLLDEIRQAFLDGDDRKAALLTSKNFNGLAEYEAADEEPFRFGNFTTCGDFFINTGLDGEDVTDYRRTLSLDSAKVSVCFTKEGCQYRRDFFTSYPDNVLVMRFSADAPGLQNLTLRYSCNPDSRGQVCESGEDGLVYVGRLSNNDMKHVVRVRARTSGGNVCNAGGILKVEGADEVVFIVSADTDYAMNFNPDFSDPKAYVGVEPENTTSGWIDRASAKSYSELYQAHYRDYSSLFRRVEFRLESEDTWEDIPIDERFRNYRSGRQDLFLEELYYQFGRYLLISSSRAGTLPANLQGIWHNGVDGPWRVDYHNNINLQMNYWPACMTNLEECMLPLVDFIRSLEKPGERVAKEYYNARGWTTSISSNIFGFASPLSSEEMTWNLCPIAGPWLATHIWDYYDYTRDKKFLEETGYSLLRSSAMFVSDYLWRRPDGLYTAAPSTSPEHGPIDEGATFVHAVARELLSDAIEASKVLGKDVSERRQWQEISDNIVPYRIGRYGQLMEWSEDIDDPSDTHRHVNHLFGLHPGSTISPVRTPDLAEAAKVVLNHRGDAATGWSMGWKLNQWARLHDGNRAHMLYSNLLKYGTADNCWDIHPPFQIDGNFGGVSGVTEMLLQSHAGFLHLLPALPDCWEAGHVSGLCARGAFEVSVSWCGGRLEAATVLSKAGEPCTVRYKDEILTFSTKKGCVYNLSLEDGHFSVDAQHIIDVRAEHGDMTEKLQEAIGLAGEYNGRDVVIRLQNADYHIFRSSSSMMEYHVSNTASEQESPSAVKHIGLLLKGLKNVTIDGNGARLVTHGEMTCFVIDSCENILLRDFIVTASDPTVPELTVTEVDGNSMTVSVHPQSRYTVEEGRFSFVGEGWSLSDGIAQSYDPERDITWRSWSPLTDLKETSEIGRNLLRFTYDKAPEAVPGMVFQMRDGIRDEVCGLIQYSRNITLEGLRLAFLGNFGIVGQVSGNLTYRNLAFEPEPGSGRTCAGFADFVQMSGCKGSIVIENSRFTGAHDDPINIHGTHLAVTEFVSPDKVSVRYMHPQTFGFQSFFAGDEIEFIDSRSLQVKYSAKVRESGMEGGRDILLELDRNLPEDIMAMENLVVENVTCTPEVIIRGNYFSRIPTRGVLVSTRRKVLIENNVFSRMQMSAVLIADDAGSWFESGMVRDVTIRNNRFVGCGSPVISVEPQNTRNEGCVHSNIRIIDNIFELDGAETAVYAKSVDGLSITGNSFYCQDKARQRKLIRTRECRNVLVDRNTCRLL